MKINEVEQQTGIAKKTIRFYEEEGLLNPSRCANGYRDYNSSDVEILSQIKLLRKLDISLEEIKSLLLGDLTMDDCLRRHMIVLERRGKNLETVTAFCKRLLSENTELGSLAVGQLLTEMENMEEGGTKFMDFRSKDKRTKKRSALIATIPILFFMALFMGIVIWGISTDPDVPAVIAVIFLASPILVIAGVVYVLRERFKEIEKGELYEASKY